MVERKHLAKPKPPATTRICARCSVLGPYLATPFDLLVERDDDGRWVRQESVHAEPCAQYATTAKNSRPLAHWAPGGRASKIA